MPKLTKSLESGTRKKIDLLLDSLGWKTNEESNDCNVFTERTKTAEQNKKLKGNFPDYVLYKSNTNEPIAVIEAKRKGDSLEKALKQAIVKYAKPLGLSIIFVCDSTFVKSWDLRSNRELSIDNEPIRELISEERLLRFIKEGSNIEEVTPEVKHTREELIRIFKWANDLLRKEGLRNLDRFVEFANILFIKIISEMEVDREKHGLPRKLNKDMCWESFSEEKDPKKMLNYINNTVLKEGLAKEYNHTDDIFQEKLKIRHPEAVKDIVNRLSGLTLINTESEIKGDAFEYFLKSLAAGNDLGEYFTPRHIVKLIVELVNPKYGQTVFDPFCGTGGFLIESFRNMKKGIDESDEKNIKVLREESIFGIELTDTYKIAKMNMIITGDGHNNIIQDDTAKNEYWENRELKKIFDKLNIKDFDIVLSNIPYGQTTDYGVLYPIVSNQGDSIFVQHLIKVLNKGGICGVIIPEGLLFKNEHKKLRHYLLSTCEVEAVISLPSGVFLPYANVKTNILIFKKGNPTKKVWFYRLENDGYELNTNRRRITQNDIPDLLAKWIDKPKSSNSFWVDISDIEKNDYKLNLNDYTVHEDRISVKFTMRKLSEVCLDIKSGGTPSRINPAYWGGDIKWVTIGDMTSQLIKDTKEQITKLGLQESAAKLLPKGTVLVSIFATLGEVAILDYEATTNQAIAGLIANPKIIDNTFLYYLLKAKKDFIEGLGRGIAQRNINLSILKEITIPVPPIDIQEKLVIELNQQNQIKEDAERTLNSLENAGISESFFASKNYINLSDAVEINPKYELTSNSENYYVDMSCIDEVTGKIKNFKKRKYDLTGLTRFKENDILYARITPCTENGKVAIVEVLNGETGIGSTEFIILSPKNVNPKWLYFWLKIPQLKEQAVKNMKGTTGRLRVPKEFFEKLKLPDIALDEQLRTTKKLETYITTKENLLRTISLSLESITRIISRLYEK